MAKKKLVKILVPCLIVAVIAGIYLFNSRELYRINSIFWANSSLGTKGVPSAFTITCVGMTWTGTFDAASAYSHTSTNLINALLLRKAVKPKLLALFIAICSVGIILVGYLFNAFPNLFI